MIFRFGPLRIPSFDPGYLVRYAMNGSDATVIVNKGYAVDSLPGRDVFAPVDAIYMKGFNNRRKNTIGYTRVPSRVGGGNATILQTPQYRFSSKMIKNGPVPLDKTPDNSAIGFTRYLKSNQFRVTY